MCCSMPRNARWRAAADAPLTAPPLATCSRAHLAYLIYTSGSTGKPKGRPTRHEGLHNRLAWMQDAYRLTGDDAVLQKTPFSFDVSVWEFFWPLIVGARLVVAAPGRTAIRRGWLRAIRRARHDDAALRAVDAAGVRGACCRRLAAEPVAALRRGCGV